MRHHRSPIVALAAGLAAACCLPLLLLADDGVGPRPAVPGAQAKAQSPVVGVPVPLDAASYAQLRDQSAIALRDWVLDDGTPIELQLEQFDVFAPAAVIVAGSADGDLPLPRPHVALFHGQVVGQPDSRVFLSVSPYGVYGVIRTTDDMHVISSGRFSPQSETTMYNLSALPEGTIQWQPFTCHSDELPLLAVTQQLETQAGQGEAASRSSACRQCEMAIETDWEFTGSLFGGDTGASSAYVATLFGAVSEIYTRDVNTRLQIVYLRLWPNSNDPWNGADTLDQLYQFQDYWNLNMTSVDRHLAHFLSGRALGGGIAYGGVICYPEYDYALSANVAGYFPYPIQNNHPQNWDLMVTAHETGHNFGAPHTHEMDPPIDGCAYGDCSIVPNATIMSYCHLCNGGMSNIRMEFHPRIINEAILPFLDTVTACDLTIDEVTITDQPDDLEVAEGQPAEFTVVATGYTPLSYQWKKDSQDIPGATDATYVIPAVQPDDAGEYAVEATNTCGSVLSDPATLTITAGDCPGDVNGDSFRNVTDFSLFALAFGSRIGDPNYNPAADMNGDGFVNSTDFTQFAAVYGVPCP
jgi:hypothetical protein